MSSASPPPSYSPRRPPPPYEEQNNRNAKKECVMGEHNYKVSPPPFVPLSGPSTIDVDQLQTVLAPNNAPPPTVVILEETKPAPSFASYDWFCPKCQKSIHTQPKFVTGALTWIVFILVLIFFFPLAFAPFCLDSCKDVHHYCPRCNNLIGIKKRIF